MSAGVRGPINKLWVIETEGAHGEGCFCVLAKTLAEAVKKISNRLQPGERIVEADTVLWVEFATVTGERGETYYYRRNHEKEESATTKTPPQATPQSSN
jgi:uncharacterized protein (DUF1697 family)